MEVELKAEDRKLLQSVIEKLSQPFPEKKPEVMPEAPRGHKTIDEIAECPDCKPKLIAKFEPEIRAKIEPEIKTKALKDLVDKAKGKYHCKGCGLKIEDPKKIEKCPLCGETHAE